MRSYAPTLLESTVSYNTRPDLAVFIICFGTPHASIIHEHPERFVGLYLAMRSFSSRGIGLFWVLLTDSPRLCLSSVCVYQLA